jgi:NADPH-dependent curcumin reductase CurA
VASVQRDLNPTPGGADQGGAATNRRILLTRLPAGRLSADVFALDAAPTPVPGPGEVLCRTLYISIDPANRAWMQGRTYRARLGTNEVMPANTLCEVVGGDLAPGTLVLAQAGWQDYAVLPVSGLDPVPEAPALRQYLGALGITGMAAYFGLHNVARVQEGDTVVISAAAGATGHLAGQLAAIHGCRVVGIAGSRAKNRWLVAELGFDGAVDYHDADWRDQVRGLCADGIDVYFDNVGGPVLEAILPLMNVHGRIACCGAIASYDTGTPDTRVAGIPGRLVNSRLRMEGFLARDFKATWASARQDIAAWLAAGEVRSVIEVVDGLDRTPEALIGLLNGDNVGKRVIRVTATRLDGSPVT